MDTLQLGVLRPSLEKATSYQTVVYPRLYRTAMPGPDDTINSRGDETVTELFRVYESGVIAISSMEFKLRVLDTAMRLFGDIKSWMLLQRNNPNLLGYNLYFLRDTMKYITTGSREMSPLVWLDVMSERSSHVTQAHHLTLKELALPAEIDTPEVLQLWCSRPGGFEDLVQSLFVLFGTTLVEEEQE
jgi:hypothetical protein